MPKAPSVPEQPLGMALAKGLARTPPLQMEKETFPPGWAAGCAPPRVLLQDLPCISTETPVLSVIQLQWMGTRSDGEMEPHTRVDIG